LAWERPVRREGQATCRVVATLEEYELHVPGAALWRDRERSAAVPPLPQGARMLLPSSVSGQMPQASRAAGQGRLESPPLPNSGINGDNARLDSMDV